MSETTIQWCDYTFNPWVGCQRVSPGCQHCYAEAYDKRVGGRPKSQRKDPEVPELRWGPKAPRVRTSAANWKKPLLWDGLAYSQALQSDRPRASPRVFCSSLADVFEDRTELVPWRLELLELIRTTRNLDWLLLTKRPEAIQALLREARRSFTTSTPLHTWLTSWLDHGQPPANVWLGTTVEDQQRADERIPELLKVPAAKRFLSCEPLLERVDLTRWLPWVFRRGLHPNPDGSAFALPAEGGGRGIDWVIIGGESGPGARPFHLDWARDLVRQCRSAGAAPFMKQLGAVPCISLERLRDPGSFEHRVQQDPRPTTTPDGTVRAWLRDPAGGNMAEWPEDLRVREWP